MHIAFVVAQIKPGTLPDDAESKYTFDSMKYERIQSDVISDFDGGGSNTKLEYSFGISR